MEPATVTQTLQRFGKFARKENWTWRYYLEPNEDGDSVHVHLVLIADSPVRHATVREFWTKALGENYQPRKSSVCFGAISSTAATGRYVTGNTASKTGIALFRKDVKLRVTGGSQNFFGSPGDALYKRLCRQDHAFFGFAIWDGDILDHPTLDYYLRLADDEYRQGQNDGTPNRVDADPFMLDADIRTDPATAPAPTATDIRETQAIQQPQNLPINPIHPLYHPKPDHEIRHPYLPGRSLGRERLDTS